MKPFTVRHWSIADTQDTTKLDLTSSPYSRYDNKSEDAVPSPDSTRVLSYPFNSRPFAVEIIAYQLVSRVGAKSPTLEEIDSTAPSSLRIAELPTVEAVSKAPTKTIDPVFTENTFNSIVKPPSPNKSTPAADSKNTSGNNTPTQSARPAELLDARGQGKYEVVPSLSVLDFHIPPSEISFEYGHELARNKTRGGWIMERSGERLVTIEVEGSSGMFFHDTEGLTRVHANATYGYFELMRLLQIYRNNGVSYDPLAGTIYTIGEVRIYYGDLAWTGSFDSFDIKENADNPYRFNYNFSFVSRGQIGDVSVRGHNIGVAAGIHRYGANTQEMLSRVLQGYRSQKFDNSTGLPGDLTTKQFSLNRLRRKSGRLFNSVETKPAAKLDLSLTPIDSKLEGIIRNGEESPAKLDPPNPPLSNIGSSSVNPPVIKKYEPKHYVRPTEEPLKWDL